MEEMQLPDIEWPPVKAAAPEVPMAPAAPELPKAAKKLLEFIDKVNIAEDLDDDLLGKIGHDVVEGHTKDWDSYVTWRTTMDAVLKLVRMEKEDKNYPWPQAANIKFPLISEAAMQFAARAYPEIVQGSNVVKTVIFGEDPDGLKAKRAQRISQHMSWQIMEGMDGWEANMDSLLHMLPIYGTVYKKTYYCPLLKENVSITLTPYEVVVNNNVKDNAIPRRLTHVMHLYDNDVMERVQGGLWLDQEIGTAQETYDPKNPGQSSTADDKDAAFHTFLEQHCWLDLDDDGYDEPYIVTVHKDTSKVMRIAACYDQESVLYDTVDGKPTLVRITANQYFTKYLFLPDQSGAWLGSGFGQLLHASNEAINTIINQLVDAGTLANLQGGFKSKDAKVAGKEPLQPGEWRSTDIPAQDLASAFFPVPFKEPSGVLYQLLGMIVESSKGFASTTAAMSGSEMPANAAATSVLAVIDQGMKVFSGIHKRVYRSLRSEFKKIAWLNSRYMDEQVYFRVLDSSENAAVGRQDYVQGDFDVVPIADPNMSTSVQKLVRAQALMEWGKSQQGVNMHPINQMFLEALQVPNIDKILPDPSQMPPPPPDPMMLDLQVKMKAIEKQFEVEMKKLDQAKEKQDAEIKKILADALLSIAKAEAAESGKNLAEYGSELKTLVHGHEMFHKDAKLGMDQVNHVLGQIPQGMPQTGMIPTTGEGDDAD